MAGLLAAVWFMAMVATLAHLARRTSRAERAYLELCLEVRPMREELEAARRRLLIFDSLLARSSIGQLKRDVYSSWSTEHTMTWDSRTEDPRELQAWLEEFARTSNDRFSVAREYVRF